MKRPTIDQLINLRAGSPEKYIKACTSYAYTHACMRLLPFGLYGHPSFRRGPPCSQFVTGRKSSRHCDIDTYCFVLIKLRLVARAVLIHDLRSQFSYLLAGIALTSVAGTKSRIVRPRDVLHHLSNTVSADFITAQVCDG